ncbi:MAG: helix-turn-helix transcriptional regulator [Anaeromusa sp.]|uniref:helix-turn-helix transcriptional regulator n=1 Tax=Anaeromusa sp. TaxID=1872520 RepID=UPI002B2060B4|nr:helix-turn-helix transcriptional regulator [Anaeromusa sp.]MEA4835421.1 helix-turn-helix transcriptional regulator [Anaeromusa sp.]
MFPQRLKEIRKSKHITQKQVASAIEATERSYQSYEYGKHQPTLPVLIALADYFDVSLDYLTGRCNNPNSHKLP